MSHVTWTPLSRSKGQRSACRGRGHIVVAAALLVVIYNCDTLIIIIIIKSIYIAQSR